MATHSDLLSKVSETFETNVRISNELEKMDARREDLERQFKEHVVSLNIAISYLPAVVNTLLIEHPPVAKGLLSNIRNAIGTSLFPSSTNATLATVEKRISAIRAMDTEFRNSEQMAKEDAYKVADLASQSAVQSVHCATILQKVSDERSKTDTQLANVNTQIKEATEAIERNRTVSKQMSAQARHHDSEANDFDNLGKYTWFIPVVNLITVPVALIGSISHEDKASECRAIETASTASIQENESRKTVLQREMSQLDRALAELKEAVTRCSSSEKQASQFKDQAKVLLDQHSVISDRLTQVIKALDATGSDVVSRPLEWEHSRGVALQSVLNMMTTLHEGGFLEQYNHDLLSRLKTIEMPSLQGPMMEIEW